MVQPTRKLPPIILRGDPPLDPNQPPQPYKTVRPKRRRKGQLNDGEWAPGHGHNEEKK